MPPRPSKLDPFKLFLMLEKNRVNLAARAGDVAPTDIVIPAGNTGQQAGPVLSEFREAGVMTKIEAGSIQVVKDSVVAKAGSQISPKLASLLSRLGIKPIRAGIAIALALENGLVYAAEAVAIDLDKYRESLVQGYSSAKALAVEIGYVTKETAPEIIAKAYREALAVAVEAGEITPESAPVILAKAEAEANATALWELQSFESGETILTALLNLLRNLLLLLLLLFHYGVFASSSTTSYSPSSTTSSSGVVAPLPPADA